MARKRTSQNELERELSTDKPGSGIPGLGIDPPLKKPKPKAKRKIKPRRSMRLNSR